MLAGVSQAKKKNGTTYYRSSFTIHSKHVSLGSYSNIEDAHQAYLEATDIVRNKRYELSDYDHHFVLPFPKFVSLMNYRNSGIYFKTPIYLQSGYFYYYLSPDRYLIFDREDLFFYANHKIQQRGGYFFICDYGSQYNILSRYGIKNYAKKGIDYDFANKNEYDFRYENINVINGYMGVTKKIKKNSTNMIYECVIHINGNYLVGRFSDEITAAIAYNKAVDTLSANGIHRKYIKNYITDLSSEEYRKRYQTIKIPASISKITVLEN